MQNTRVLLSVTNLKKYFPLKKSSVFSKTQLYVRANDDISIDIHEGETIGLVGESGCGKSTFGRTVLQLYPQTAGTTMYYGKTLEEVTPKYVEDTLRHAAKYIAAYHEAVKHTAKMKEVLDAQGDKATYTAHQSFNDAEDAEAKALENAAKILGGFMTLHSGELATATNMLLSRYHIGVKLSTLRAALDDIGKTNDALSALYDEAETGKKAGAARKIEANRKKFDALKSEITSVVKKYENADANVKKLIEKYSGNEEFDRFEKMRDEGVDLTRLTYNEIRPLRKDIQIIFQDPYSSLNPRMTVGQIIEEGLITHNFYKPGSPKMKEHILKTMNACGLQDYMLHRYPHQFSGGQRQRICIARALAVNPKLVVCDEAVSALDVSIQSQIINLLQDLREKQNLTYLFISHDLSVVKYISDRIGVMYLGNLVELSTSEETFSDPRHPYTVALLSSIPTTDLDNKKERIILEGGIPSPINPPTGCKFHTRCFMATEKCSRVPPKFEEVEPGHFVACHYPERKLDALGNPLFKINAPKSDAPKPGEPKPADK